MWGKTSERDNETVDTTRASAPRPYEGSAPPAAFGQPKPPIALVGKTMRLQGEIYSDEEFYLDGEVEGSLEVSQRLTIGPNGKIKANVKAKELVVKGKIQGNVESAGRIVIMNGASIVGDVKTAGIVIEDGAFFKGGIDILRADVKQPEASGVLAASAGPPTA
jgi:cytoskeletal protein CcmA (bactofilin family)